MADARLALVDTDDIEGFAEVLWTYLPDDLGPDSDSPRGDVLADIVKALKLTMEHFVEDAPTETAMLPWNKQVELNALRTAEDAARELDAFFDQRNEGSLHGEWKLHGRRQSVSVSDALLSLHDRLNDVEAVRSGVPGAVEHYADDRDALPDRRDLHGEDR